jgi:hypothetical protein
METFSNVFRQETGEYYEELLSIGKEQGPKFGEIVDFWVLFDAVHLSNDRKSEIARKLLKDLKNRPVIDNAKLVSKANQQAIDDSNFGDTLC